MELYLLRHGLAEDAAPGKPDSSRELTPEGAEKVAAVTALASRSGATPTLILSSPYVRAVETARVAAKEFAFRGLTLRTEVLVPFGAPEDVWSQIRDHDDEGSILLAGHEPLLSRLAAFLLGAPDLRIEMKKASLIRIDLDLPRSRSTPPRGVLRWMLTAKLAS